ncbi:MAG: methyltransferase domain-containing protein, partial [Candidatus Pacebacteria bacterium]|nr:methyltransferase domain-containing protein [Candidatus Paceibacterota bacterium]
KKGLLNRHYLVLNDDITDTKLEDCFEMVTCISTLEHIEKYDQAVKNMFSLVAAGGHVVLTFPYNEKRGVHNVYNAEGTSMKNLPDHTTHAYSRKDLERWCTENDAEIIEQEYWQFFTGEYWTGGEMLPYPKKVSSSEKHQISCVLLRKNRGEI